MAFTEIQTYKRRLYLPMAKESSYNDGDTESTVDWIVDPLDAKQFRTSKRVLNDRLKATGKEFAGFEMTTEEILPVQPVRLWASSNSIAWGLAFAMGNDGMDGSGTNRTHALTMCANNEFPGSFGMLDYISGPNYVANHDFGLAGCYVDSLTLNWGREDLVEQILNIGGSGKRTTPSNVTESGLDPMAGTGYMLANKVRVTIASASAERDSAWGGTWTVQSSVGTFANTLSGGLNLSEFAESFSLSYTNGFQRTHSGGMSAQAGVIGVQPRLGRTREVRLSCNMLQTSTSFTKAILNQTYLDNAEWTIIIEMVTDDLITTGVYHSVGIVLPLVGLAAQPESDGPIDGLRGETLEFYAKFEDASDYDACYAFVENGVTTVYNQAA